MSFNIAILDVKQSERNVNNSITVAYRNLLELKKYLKADLFVNVSDINFTKKYDAILCGFGSMATEKENSLKFINSNPNAELFWLIGEYEQGTFAPLFYAKRPYIVIKNFMHHFKNKQCKAQHYVNFNSIISRKPNKLTEKKYDCVYYSRWRPDRAKYCREYLQSGIYLSTSVENIKYFKHCGSDARWIKPLTWKPGKEQLNYFRYALYLEDEFTHTHYNSLANRWYEAGICNNVVFFDQNCIETIKQSHLSQHLNQVLSYCVSGHSELMQKVKKCNADYLKHLEIQQSWRKSEPEIKQKALNEIKMILMGEKPE